jgi:hypothetical protein
METKTAVGRIRALPAKFGNANSLSFHEVQREKTGAVSGWAQAKPKNRFDWLGLGLTGCGLIRKRIKNAHFLRPAPMEIFRGLNRTQPNEFREKNSPIREYKRV